jgi:hypothetical protein
VGQFLVFGLFRDCGVRVGEEIALAAEAVPVATAAIGMYGQAVLAKAWDDVADATIKGGPAAAAAGLRPQGRRRATWSAGRRGRPPWRQ